MSSAKFAAGQKSVDSKRSHHGTGDIVMKTPAGDMMGLLLRPCRGGKEAFLDS